MKRCFAGFAAGILAVAHLGAQAPAPAPGPAAPTPPPLWSLTGDFQSPESAYYHAASNAVFVSSINGGITEKDGNGYISRLTPEGKVVNAKWATGLNGPKGIRSVGNTLWVADIDEVVGIDIGTGKISSRVAVEGATFLNDLATAPDGTIYVSDSFGPRVYAVRDGKASVFLEGNDTVEQVNGLLVDGNRLITGSIGPAAGRGGAPRGGGAPRAGGPPPGGQPGTAEGRRGGGADPAAEGRRGGGAGRGRGAAGGGGNLYAFDLATKARTKLTEGPVGGVDGIEPDGRGGVLLTDVIGRRILHVPSSGQTRVVAQLSGGGADFGFIVKQNIAIVPYLNEHKVEAYDLSALLK
jgi:hypothetical protein